VVANETLYSIQCFNVWGVAGINVETLNRRSDHIRNRIRGDMKAATLVTKRLSWLHLDKRIVGLVHGVYVRDFFFLGWNCVWFVSYAETI
jgi:hypothetical protein